jgi:acetyl esterase/lipase
MAGMGIRADVSAYLMQKLARRRADYGRSLYFSGTDLPGPGRIRVPTRHGPVRCDVYRPKDDGSAPPVYVHLHGGAFVMRYPRMDDFFARFVAAECRAAVLNVDYDVAPQVRYPVAQEQAHDAAAWVAAHGHEAGLDGQRIAVGGFSAGGNLAASAVLQARDLGSFRPALQVLGVPSLDVAGDADAKTSPVPNPMVSPALLRMVRATYFKDERRRAEPYASPLLAPDLTGLPRTVVVTAEYDVLRAEGDAYAARLAEAGVDVVHRVVTGRDHYFLEGDRDRARSTLDLIAHSLREALGTVW